MIKGKLVVVSNLTTFKTIQQSSDPIPDSAIVFIKNEGQIWTKGSYFGVQKTYDVVSKTDAGLAPKGGDSASSLIANVDDEWVLTVTNGANPSWRKLPANAFKNQTYTFYNLAFKNSSGTTVDTYKPSTSPSKSVKAGTNVKISASSNTITISATDTTYNAFTGASDSTNGSLGLVPKPTKGNQSKFLKADGSWATPTDTTYPVVTSTKDGLVPKFDANDGTIDQLDKDWVLTNNNGSIGWYKLPANAFNNSTYSLVSNSSNGLVPILPTTNSTTISTQADEWVLTTTKGGEPSWRKLPTTAFYSLPTAKTNTLGGIKVGSVSTSAFADLTGKYYKVNVDKNGVAYVNVPWTDTPYTLPKASSTLGGVKTTSTVTSTTGLTACPIIDGVVYYKDSDSNTWRGIYVGGTSKMGTANNTKALNFAAGDNVTISYAAPGTASGQSGNASYGTLTINATNTWTAWKGATSSANGTAGYMPAPTSALRNQFLRGDGTWQSLNNYSLPTASSSTLGGVKTGAAITDTTGYTPVHIKDGVIYYKGSSTGYLPLSGGTITSSSITPLLIKGEHSGKAVTIRLANIDKAVADFGHTSDDGVYIQDFISGYYIGVKTDGTPYFHNGDFRTLIHSSNIANYNAGSATKLQTARTIWGLSFDGTADITAPPKVYKDTSSYVAFYSANGSTYYGDIGFSSGSPAIWTNALKSWKNILHEGNYSSYALPLSGGTMNDGAHITMKSNVTSGNWIGSSKWEFFAYSNTFQFRKSDYDSNTYINMLTIGPDSFAYKDQTVYHSGNITTALSNYVDLSSDQIITGKKTFSNPIFSKNNVGIWIQKSQAGTNNTNSVPYIRFGKYTANNVCDNTTVNGELGVNDSKELVFYKGTTGDTWNKVWHSGNFNPENYLPLSGGTLTNSGSALLTLVSDTHNYVDIKYVSKNATTTWCAGADYLNTFYFWNNTLNKDVIKIDNQGEMKFIGASDDSRYTISYHGGIKHYGATGGWAMGSSFFKNDGTYMGESHGGYGSNGGFDYFFYGGSYNSAAMYIKNGNVGIGTNSPETKFHIKGGNMFLYSSGTPYIAFKNDDGSSYYCDIGAYKGVASVWHSGRGWETILTSGNWSSYISVSGGNFLPLSGGTMAANARIGHGTGNSNLYLGNSANNGWVMLQDCCSQSGHTYWNIYTSGNALFLTLNCATLQINGSTLTFVT